MSKSWKNGINWAILRKCDESDQSRRGKRDSKIRKNQKKLSKSLDNWKMGYIEQFWGKSTFKALDTAA